MSPDTTDYDVTEKVEQTKHGWKIEMESTRGTGTRDQDTVKIQGRAESISDLLGDADTARDELKAQLNNLRANQPDESEDGGDE